MRIARHLAALCLLSVLLSPPASAAARGAQAEEMALTRARTTLEVFDRVDVTTPGIYRWPLLSGARHIEVQGGRLLGVGRGTASVVTERSFTLTYRVPEVGETYVFVRSFPYAVGSFVVFTGRGVSGGGEASLRPLSVTPVAVGGVRLTAFAFGRVAQGRVLRWALLTGAFATHLGDALLDFAFVVLAAALVFVWIEARRRHAW